MTSLICSVYHIKKNTQERKHLIQTELFKEDLQILLNMHILAVFLWHEKSKYNVAGIKLTINTQLTCTLISFLKHYYVVLYYL